MTKKLMTDFLPQRWEVRKMLKMIHIEKSFNIGTINEKKVLSDLNLTINDGDFITVVLIPAVQGRCDVVGFAPDLFF